MIARLTSGCQSSLRRRGTHHASRRTAALSAAAAILAGMTPAAFADDAGAGADLPALPASENIYAEMSLEDLMRVQVRSVSGVAADWFKSPAAVYVIDGEMIRNSGHQHLAELLRLVPGAQVARVNAREWAVSMRGFNGEMTNKLQVLIDGRSIYDPTMAGVRWQFQDLLLEDIEQIEVIRGPGATLWGANAVNGVVNIETKSARDTQGLYLKQVFGNELRSVTAARYGGQSGDDTWYRVWGKYANRDSFDAAPGTSDFDDWEIAHGGFRIDHAGNDDTTMTLTGGGFGSGRMGDRFQVPAGIPFTTEAVTRDSTLHGAYLVGRIQNEGVDEGWTALAQIDHTDYYGIVAIDESLLNFSIDWRHHFKPTDRHELIWGANYQASSYRTQPSHASLVPHDDTLHVGAAFVQDTITLVPDRWFVMFGSKFEYNEFSGFEVQPSARLWWTPDDRQTFWAAVSRAIHRPAAFEERLNFTMMNTGFPPPQDAVRIQGSDLDAESVLAYEAGYRNRLTQTLLIDTAAFYNRYDDLITYGWVNPLLLQTSNDLAAQSYGLEIAAKWEPASNFRLSGSYSLLVADGQGIGAAVVEDNAPTHTVQVSSDWGITDDLTLHQAVYFVDDVAEIPSYVRFDAGLTWNIRPNVDLSIWGQNLLDSAHPEFFSSTMTTTPTEVERSVYVQLEARF